MPSAFFRLPSPRRCIILLLIIAIPALAYLVWQPGTRITDGRHDLGRNGIWMQHGWLGDDRWFQRNGKLDRMPHFRSEQTLRETAALLRRHHMADVFPHLCPTDGAGRIAAVDPAQVERFLDAFAGFRVMPWVGGVLDNNALIREARWRKEFVGSIAELLERHPRLAGIHVNIEPMPSGTKEFLVLLDELRAALPKGKVLSVAAYPPPTVWHRFPNVHWEESYFQQVAARADQVAVMLYDTSLHNRKVYQNLLRAWTKEVLEWSPSASVLLGVPAYEDAGVGYHDPGVENLATALPGIHAGLAGDGQVPANYQGVAVYCEWEMDEGKWQTLRKEFLSAR